MFSLAFYWSLIISQFFDVKRKDFWQMVVHHIATIGIMTISWVCNLHRILTLGLLVHDCADIFIEVSCMCLKFVCEFVNTCFRCLHKCINLLISVTYPGFLFGGDSNNLVEDRGQTERGSGGGSPLFRGSTQFAND
jgi:hypothetical protein